MTAGAITRRATVLPVAALLTAVALLGGCGSGAGEAPTGVTLRITADYGQQVIAEPKPPQVAGGDTVLRLLERNLQVKTTFGGGYVDTIEGRRASTDGASTIDWAYYVGGLPPERGANAWRLSDDEQVWWDLHRWDHARVSAVVGQFPEPMLRGSGGRYRGAWLICRGAEGGCKIAQRQLQAAGIAVDNAAAVEGRTHTKVVVGRWTEIKDLAPEIGALANGPRSTGVFVRIDGAGTLTALRDDGTPVPSPAQSGVIAAVRRPGGVPTWVVTGPTDASVRRAARQLQTGALAGRFAVLATPGGPQPLPMPHGAPSR